MNLSDIPAWFAKRFGADATATYIRPIPTTSADPNAASLSLGFPPNTFAALGAGGSPQDGRDVNGILNQLSAWAQWAGVGGPTPWSSAISSAAGGYPLGAIVLSNSTTGRLYQSQVNANTTDPDAGGAGWAILVDKAATPSDISAGTSNERVVTPAGLAGAGYDRVVAQSLIANGGFRQYASGYKECWGFLTIPADGTANLTLPIPHTSWSSLVLGPNVRNQIGASDNMGIISRSGANDYVLCNWDQPLALRCEWQSKGV